MKERLLYIECAKAEGLVSGSRVCERQTADRRTCGLCARGRMVDVLSCICMCSFSFTWIYEYSHNAFMVWLRSMIGLVCLLQRF
jgi:hypothetical protein